MTPTEKDAMALAAIQAVAEWDSTLCRAPLLEAKAHLASRISSLEQQSKLSLSLADSSAAVAEIAQSRADKAEARANRAEAELAAVRKLPEKWRADARKTIGRGGIVNTLDAAALNRCADEVDAARGEGG